MTIDLTKLGDKARQEAAEADHLEFLRAYEKAARIYCGKMGLDPDGMIQVPHPTVKGAMSLRARWMFAAQELIEFAQKLTSLREAIEGEPETPPAQKAN